MGKGSGNGTTRGDRKRNARRERLRGLLPRDGAVIGIDLAEDKQAVAVIDHDVRVLARKGRTLITENRNGIVQAAAGVDGSNVGSTELALLSRI